jgi:hypothetical protein
VNARSRSKVTRIWAPSSEPEVLDTAVKVMGLFNNTALLLNNRLLLRSAVVVGQSGRNQQAEGS